MRRLPSSSVFFGQSHHSSWSVAKLYVVYQQPLSADASLPECGHTKNRQASARKSPIVDSDSQGGKVMLVFALAGRANERRTKPTPSHAGNAAAERIRSVNFGLLRWRRRRKQLALASRFRFGLRLGSLLRFFSAFIFASHASKHLTVARH